ncbi:MAG: CBS domain-containing protein [Longimicrobiales bacterium]|nr:CBS domain-containing protein [Longimicrobiales bacterium]
MSIGRICSRVIVTAAPDERVKAVAERMADQNVGSGEEGALAGIVSLDDILELLVEEVERIGAILRKESPRITGEA